MSGGGVNPLHTRFGIRWPKSRDFKFLCYQCASWTPSVYTWPTYPAGGASGRCHGHACDAYSAPCPLFSCGGKADMPEIGDFGEVVS